MRKFSKIFAALLSICLVIGAVMVVALAKAPASTTDLGYSDDYEGYSAGDTVINNSFGDTTYSSTEIINDAENNNKYLRLSYLKAATRQYERYFDYAEYPNAMISDYSYFTLDFDFCADKYVYSLNGNTEMGETVPEGATDVKLAYFEGMGFSLINEPIINGSPSSNGSTAMQVNLNYDSEASAWRIYLNNRATDYCLSNELGGWNHFTYAVKVIEKDGSYGYSEVRLYFDGYLIGTSKINGDAVLKRGTDVALKSIKWFVGTRTTPVKAPYSMGIDNYTPAFYPAGYVSDEKYGIDDLFEDADTTKSIAYCNDVVYSSDYAKGKSFISVDAGISYCRVPAIMADVLASMRNGTVIETNMKLHDFTPPAGVDSFEVCLRDGGEFSLSKEAAQVFVQKISPLGYRVSKLSTDDAIVINWLDSKGGKLIKSELLTAETAPAFAHKNLPVIDFEKGIISESKVTNWLWDLDGEGNSDLGLDNPEESIRKLSDAEIKIVKQYCDGVIDIYPESVEEVGTTELAYAIEYKNADGQTLALVDSNGAYAEYTDIATFAANVSNAPDGAIVYVYKSGSVNDTVTVGEGIELCIDLRGAALDFAADAAFVLSNDSVLNVYSSVEGAFLNFSDVGFSTVGASNGFNNCDVVIGAYGEFAGDNLSVSGATVFEIATSYTGANDDKAINVAIDCKVLNGSFYFAASDVNVAINNTDISGDVIFNSDSDVEVFTDLEVNVKISGSSVSARALVGEWGAGSVVSIESSLVVSHAAPLDGDVEGDVVFGADNALTYDVRAEGDFVSAEEGVAFANAALSIGEEGEYLISVLTFEIATASSDDFVLVVWNDALGNEFVSDYYHKSLSYANSPLKSEMTDASKFPIVEDLGNGWYDIGYTSWRNTAEGSVDNAIVMGSTNVFIPVANGPVASLDFMVNAALRTTEVGLNLYVEIPEEGIIVDVESALYYVDDEGIRVQTTLLTGFAGAEGYYAYELPLAVASFDAREAFIVFAVSGFDGNGDGVIENTEEDYVLLFKEFSIDFMVYAETAAELYACGSDDSKLIFDLVQYKYNAYLASVAEEDVDEKIVERVSDLLASHGEGCACATDLESLEFTDKELGATIDEDAADKILAAGVDFENGKPALYFYVDASIDVESFSIKHKGLEYQAGGWDYINHKLICEPVAVGEGEINGVACVVYEYEDILLCNVSAIMNITLEINTGDEAAPVIETVSTSWSLASYIESSEDNTLEKALYAASKSALEYRFVREGE